MKTCKQIKREYDEAWDKLRTQCDADMLVARAREFPVGTKVLFPIGFKRLEGVVHQLGEYEWNTDEVVVRNPKSRAEHKVKVWDLVPVPPPETTTERLKRERVGPLKLDPGRERSKCCGGTVSVEGDKKEGTCYYECNTCGNACDLKA